MSFDTGLWVGNNKTIFLPQELAQLESLCAQFYGSTDPAARAEAEKALVLFTETAGGLSKCQYLLERAQVEINERGTAVAN